MKNLIFLVVFGCCIFSGANAQRVDSTGVGAYLPSTPLTPPYVPPPPPTPIWYVDNAGTYTHAAAGALLELTVSSNGTVRGSGVNYWCQNSSTGATTIPSSQYASCPSTAPTKMTAQLNFEGNATSEGGMSGSWVYPGVTAGSWSGTGGSGYISGYYWSNLGSPSNFIAYR